LQYKKLWKPFYFREQFTGGLHSYFRYTTIKRYFEDHLNDLKENRLQPDNKTLQDILVQVSDLEQINESFYFKYKESEVLHLIQQALFFSIKKAFTPFAVLYMLKQMQMAEEK
jgi:hypothetical protein